MGSMIHLAVGRLEIDWGKNHGFTDHSALFQGEADVQQVAYYYAGDERDDGTYDVVVEYKEGLSKPLHQIVDRLNLLGHTIESARREYSYIAELNSFDEKSFPFEKLQSALAAVDVASLSPDYGEGGEDFGKFFRRQIAPRLNLQTTDWNAELGMENISAATILQLLANNSGARDLAVTWTFSDLEEAGWETRDTFVRELVASDRFLVVTEGSSDAAILGHALHLLTPHTADFFQFIDMEEGYPFSGTGNVVRFVQGLISIGILNRVIVLFDNDAEGVASLRRCQAMNLPDNMRVLKLPNLAEFSAFPTLGPSGSTIADINERAASIECYLDLGGKADVRWTNFNAETQQYQGSLVDKRSAMQAFLKQRKRSSTYNYSKLSAVLKLLTDAASAMREAELKVEFET
ncbi:MAG: HEPN/Toprim-associated domain-containing protein [Hyphomonadaceae bacterium]